jgi:DNA-binding MarR family transcriptional regulator
VPAASDGPGTASAPVNTDYLQTLVGYNARRAALAVISTFLERMAPFGVRPVDFSVLSVIRHNPGVTSRQLCASLGLLPPNLVTLLNQFEKRNLIVRRPHPHDGRAVALSLSAQGEAMMAEAEAEASALELDVTVNLTDKQRQTLMQLLRKVYEPPSRR